MLGHGRGLVVSVHHQPGMCLHKMTCLCDVLSLATLALPALLPLGGLNSKAASP